MSSATFRTASRILRRAGRLAPGLRFRMVLWLFVPAGLSLGWWVDPSFFALAAIVGTDLLFFERPGAAALPAAWSLAESAHLEESGLTVHRLLQGP